MVGRLQRQPPHLAGKRACLEAELVDERRFCIRSDATLDDGVQLAAELSETLEATASTHGGGTHCSSISCGKVWMIGAPHPRDFIWRLEQASIGGKVQQKRAELVAHPERAIGQPDHRFGIEVC